MNQHDEHHDHEQGDASVDEAQPGPVEHHRREEHPDVAEHEAAVPSTTTNGLREGGPDVAEHEAAVPSSVEDGSPEPPAQSTTAAAGPGMPDAGEQSATTAIPPTGDDRVDEALSRLAELDRLDVTEHAGVVEDVHRALQDTLAEEED